MAKKTNKQLEQEVARLQEELLEQIAENTKHENEDKKFKEKALQIDTIIKLNNKIVELEKENKRLKEK